MQRSETAMLPKIRDVLSSARVVHEPARVAVLELL